jgi:hypothetical protein
MTGVWMTEASGFAAVPPRADAGMPVAASSQTKAPEAYPENELMMARGEPDDRGAVSEAQAADAQRDAEPRIERYPER